MHEAIAQNKSENGNGQGTFSIVSDQLDLRRSSTRTSQKSQRQTLNLPRCQHEFSSIFNIQSPFERLLVAVLHRHSKYYTERRRYARNTSVYGQRKFREQNCNGEETIKIRFFLPCREYANNSSKTVSEIERDCLQFRYEFVSPWSFSTWLSYSSKWGSYWQKLFSPCAKQGRDKIRDF